MSYSSYDMYIKQSSWVTEHKITDEVITSGSDSDVPHN